MKHPMNFPIRGLLGAQEATAALMPHLPGLLRKYQTDAAASAALAGILGHLSLELFTVKSQEKALVDMTK